MRAKRIVERRMDEEAIPPEILEQQATESRLEDEKKVENNYKRPLI